MRKILVEKNKYLLEPDTPVDLSKFRREDSRSYYEEFRKNLYEGKVEIFRETYEKVKYLVEKLSKKILGWQLELPPYEKIKEMRTYYIDFKKTFKSVMKEEEIYEKSIVIFVGRSSLPLTLVLEEYLKDIVEKDGYVVVLRSRHESKGGLREGIALSGMKYISQLIERRGIRNALIIDDVANTGRTFSKIAKEISRYTKKIMGIVAILNYSTYILRHNRFLKKLRKNIPRETLENFVKEKLLEERNKIWIDNFPLYPSQAIIARGVQPFTHGFGDFIEEAYENRKIKCLKNSEKELLDKTIEEIQLYEAFKKPVRKLVEEIEFIRFAPPTR